MARLLPEGLQSTTENGYRRQYEAKIRETWGQDVGFDPQTPQGQQSRVLSAILAEQEQTLVGVFNGLFLGTASGSFLDNWGNAFGARRQLPTFTNFSAKVTGRPNTDYPVGTIIQSDTGARFSNVEPIQLDGSGEGTGKFFAELIGEIRVTTETILSIVSTVPGVIGITDITDIELGRNVESDTAFRSRLQALLGTAQVGTLEALQSGISILEGVTHVRVLSNPTTTPTTVATLAVPASAIMVIIRGGKDDSIASSLERVLPLGQLTTGNTSIVRDGVTYRIQRVTDRKVKVVLGLSITNEYPQNGNDLIRANLLEFFAGLQLGEWFDVTELNRPIYNVGGHVVSSITVTYGNNLALTDETSLPGDVLYTLASEDIIISLVSR